MYSLVIFLKDFFIYLRLLHSFLPMQTHLFQLSPLHHAGIKIFSAILGVPLIDPKMCLDKSAWEQLGYFRLACIFEKHFT